MTIAYKGDERRHNGVAPGERQEFAGPFAGCRGIVIASFPDIAGGGYAWDPDRLIEGEGVWRYEWDSRANSWKRCG